MIGIDLFALLERNKQALRYAPDLKRLRERLLGIGGQEVALPEWEPDLDLILARGETWRGGLREPGPYPYFCHANVAAMYLRQKRKLKRIATGYALDRSGIWVQHTWLVDRGRALETTPIPRAIYHGFVLKPREADLFSRTTSSPRDQGYTGRETPSEIHSRKPG